MTKTTSTERVQKRRKKLNAIAKKQGYDTWYRLTTAILHGEVLLTHKERSIQED